MIKINITYLKILDSINCLNKQFYYPSIKGLAKFLNGEIDEDTSKFTKLENFSCLISLKGRKLSSKVHQLIRYKYLEYKLNKIDNLLYLKISNLGLKTLKDNKEKLHYKKVINKNIRKQEIVKII